MLQFQSFWVFIFWISNGRGDFPRFLMSWGPRGSKGLEVLGVQEVQWVLEYWNLRVPRSWRSWESRRSSESRGSWGFRGSQGSCESPGVQGFSGVPGVPEVPEVPGVPGMGPTFLPCPFSNNLNDKEMITSHLICVIKLLFYDKNIMF